MWKKIKNLNWIAIITWSVIFFIAYNLFNSLFDLVH
jgi:hypothetical protein